MGLSQVWQCVPCNSHFFPQAKAINNEDCSHFPFFPCLLLCCCNSVFLCTTTKMDEFLLPNLSDETVMSAWENGSHGLIQHVMTWESTEVGKWRNVTPNGLALKCTCTCMCALVNVSVTKAYHAIVNEPVITGVRCRVYKNDTCKPALCKANAILNTC